MTSTTTVPPTGRTTGRIAAAGLLALSMMLGACTAPAEVQRYIADAQVQAATLGAELEQLADGTTDDVPLSSEASHAVDSAQAATGAALSALAGAAESRDDAVVALADAQVALEAASAELRHVIDHAELDTSVRITLGELHEQITALRGDIGA